MEGGVVVRRILSTLDRWWSSWLSYVTSAVFVALLAAGSFLHLPALTVAAWTVFGVSMVVTAVYGVLAIRAYRRLRASRQSKRHEPKIGCHVIHCYSCNIDEPPAPAYIVCGECGHVYRSARSLRRAYRREVRQVWLRPRDSVNLFGYIGPLDRLRSVWAILTIRASKIYFCQECIHDF